MKAIGRALPYLLIALGAILILIGIWGGEVAVVFSRAINICLECIGIG
ncbi:MAG: CD1871A family CXXC motif-containing protein [Eubacteriales bacterium]|nr:CD1871A family CXXC motif-containing protein [Eubacteriales bacterium]